MHRLPCIFNGLQAYIVGPHGSIGRSHLRTVSGVHNLGYKVVSGSPSGNTLTLTGTAKGNTIAGNRSLTGGNPTACQGSGTFTMTKS